MARFGKISRFGQEVLTFHQNAAALENSQEYGKICLGFGPDS
jgi:hypothetical protein